MKPYVCSNEMFWRPDPDKDAARNLPDWVEFHRECGKVGLAFDTPNRERNRGPFLAVAFTAKKTDMGGWQSFELARATGRNFLQTMKEAHDKSGRATETTTALIKRMIKPYAEQPRPAEDPLAAMFGDPLEGMFG